MVKILPKVYVKNLGRMTYRKAFDLQKAAEKNILQCLRSDNLNSIVQCLFLVEHEPVYTIGIRDKHYKDQEEELLKLSADFVKTDRGGLITFHGPGQLVSYPVLYLGQFRSKSIKWYVHELENTIIGTCKHFGLEAYADENVGVWINDRKIASIGIHASRHVTTHGIAINCNTDLKWFSHIVPCGIPGKETTSLSKELRQDISVQEAIPLFLENFKKHFECHFVFDN